MYLLNYGVTDTFMPVNQWHIAGVQSLSLKFCAPQLKLAAPPGGTSITSAHTLHLTVYLYTNTSPLCRSTLKQRKGMPANKSKDSSLLTECFNTESRCKWKRKRSIHMPSSLVKRGQPSTRKNLTNFRGFTCHNRHIMRHTVTEDYEPIWTTWGSFNVLQNLSARVSSHFALIKTQPA